MDLQQAISKTVDAFAALMQYAQPALDAADRESVYGAAKTQCRDDDRLAWQIADFLPIALARAELAGKGVKLSDHYVRIDSRGRLRTYRPLKDEAVYREAAGLAPELHRSQPSAAARLAKISVEHQSVAEALRRAASPRTWKRDRPVLNGPDELCDPLEQPPVFDSEPWWLADLRKRQRPWWKFW